MTRWLKVCRLASTPLLAKRKGMGVGVESVYGPANISGAACCEHRPRGDGSRITRPAAAGTVSRYRLQPSSPRQALARRPGA